MKEINIDVCKQLGFTFFGIYKLKLDDNFYLVYNEKYKSVILYKKTKEIVIIKDYYDLTNFLKIYGENSLNDAINYITTPRNFVKKEQNTIKKEIVSELIKFTDGKYMIYLQKDGNKIKILNEFKKEIFIFQNPEISKKVCELIIYAFNNI